MNAKQLRNSILQMAIEGKLVPQDPNDEPASVLLDKIRKEKKRLVKEGKLKKKDLEETPISDDEKPFEIPESWEWCRLGDFFKTSSGTTPSSKNADYYKNGDINWVRTTDLNNGVLTSCEIQITKKAVDDCNLKIIPRDSVCIAMYGGGGTIGKNSIIQFDTTINQSVCAIHPNFICNMKYIHFFIQYQRPYWMDFASGSRKDPNINQVIIKKCILPLPPLAEQHRIVAKLEEILPLVDEYGKAQEEADKLQAELPDKLRKSILQEAIQGKLVPQDPNDEPASVLLDKIRQEKKRLVKEGVLKKKDLEETPISEDEKPFEIPESWVWCRLNSITELIEDCPHSTAPDEGAGYPLIRTPNVGFGKLLLDGVHRVSEDVYNKRNERATPQANDLIYAREATAGNIAVIRNGQKVCLGQRTVLVRPMKNQVNSNWLAYFILSPYSYRSLVGESTGTTVAHVNLSDFRPFILPLPPLAEQHRIVAKIEELFNQLKL